MNLSKYSRNRILATMSLWDMPKEFADTLYNYLVYGFEPGSCFTGILANNFHQAIGSSHPNNTINALKSVSGWINDAMPAEAHGSYEAVKKWCCMDIAVRRTILEKQGLVFNKEDEVILVLQGEAMQEPVLY